MREKSISCVPKLNKNKKNIVKTTHAFYIESVRDFFFLVPQFSAKHNPSENRYSQVHRMFEFGAQFYEKYNRIIFKFWQHVSIVFAMKEYSRILTEGFEKL